jgi:hypothetical protein
MKRLTLALIGVSILAVAVVSATAAAVTGWRVVARSDPRLFQSIGLPLNVRSISPGRIHETDSYESTDTPATVLKRYAGHYQPEPGQFKPGQCILLRQAASYWAFRQTELVTLCPVEAGTRVSVLHDVFLTP